MKITLITNFDFCDYLVNKLGASEKIISNVGCCSKEDYNRTVHETWNEEIFLKACGIEVDSLEQQLQKAEAEVKRLQSLIEEENKPKVGDWIFFNNGETKGIDVINSIEEHKYSYCTQFCCYSESEVKKITNKDLIKLLEQEIK